MNKKREDYIHILQVNKLYYPYTGGIEHVVKQIAEGLNDSVDMKVLVCQEKGKGKLERINGVWVYRAASFGKWGNLPIPKHFIWDFKRLARNADIVHIHMPFPFADIAYLVSGYKGKVVIWYHSDVVRQKKMMIFYKPIMKKLLQRADKIIVATEGNLNGSSYLKEFRQKCVIIPFGVDKNLECCSDRYYKSLEKKKKERKVKTTGIKFLFIGRFVYYKGCDVLLKAFARLPEAAELTLVGDGVLKENLKALTLEKGISKRVHFVGNLQEKELIKILEECDVLVLPSTAPSEAFGIVQIEAMAFGKPVINTRLKSGVPYVSLDGITGITVTPGKIDELYKAMKWMMEHEREREEMGAKARERMKQEYQSQKMLERVKNLYQSMMDNERK